MKLEGMPEEYGIYGMLFSLSNRIQTIGDKEFAGITLKQQFVLIGLGMFMEPPTLSQMGELIGCSYQNVKRMADHLVKEGYLRMERDPEDMRRVLMYGTDKIEQEAERNRGKTEHFMQTLYRDIPREELRKVLKILIQMDQNIGGLIE